MLKKVLGSSDTLTQPNSCWRSEIDNATKNGQREPSIEIQKQGLSTQRRYQGRTKIQTIFILFFTQLGYCAFILSRYPAIAPITEPFPCAVIGVVLAIVITFGTKIVRSGQPVNKEIPGYNSHYGTLP